jgi:alpha-tubulin suppressor-like RCC1 family protein
MLLPGHKINLSVLYNLVFGRSDNDEMIYILGDNSIIPHVETMRATENFGTYISDFCMSFFRVEHPDLIKVTKIACGTDFILALNGFG